MAFELLAVLRRLVDFLTYLSLEERYKQLRLKECIVDGHPTVLSGDWETYSRYPDFADQFGLPAWGWFPFAGDDSRNVVAERVQQALDFLEINCGKSLDS